MHEDRPVFGQRLAECRGFPTVWERISQTVDGPTQVDETQQVCSGFKGQDPPREGLDRGGSPEGGRTRWTGDQGDEMTLVAACRDVLRVVSAQEGSDYEDDLAPVIEDADDLSQSPLPCPHHFRPIRVRIRCSTLRSHQLDRHVRP